MGESVVTDGGVVVAMREGTVTTGGVVATTVVGIRNCSGFCADPGIVTGAVAGGVVVGGEVVAVVGATNAAAGALGTVGNVTAELPEASGGIVGSVAAGPLASVP